MTRYLGRDIRGGEMGAVNVHACFTLIGHKLGERRANRTACAPALSSAHPGAVKDIRRSVLKCGVSTLYVGITQFI